MAEAVGGEDDWYHRWPGVGGGSARKDRNDLFRAGILAFERVGLRQVIDDLESLGSLTAVDLLPVLASQETYEAALWVDILRSRIEAIAKFKEISSNDEKEKVLQAHLFRNLWMLDASWERATQSPRMEEDLREIEPGVFSLDDAGKARTGRIDIRYATTGGKHIIVELKRYSVNIDISKLMEQGTKYAVALRDLLDKSGQLAYPELIEVVFVLGSKPKAAGRGLMTEDQYIKTQLSPINGRYVLYDELISNAKNQYSDYLDASEKAKGLEDLLESLDDDSET